jgi:tetratricopeptide (TPR) repeat protein
MACQCFANLIYQTKHEPFKLKKMKTLTLIATLLFATTIGFAQSANYASDMQKGINILDTMKTQSSYVVASNHFEKIANAEKQWLPLYYAAYSNLMIAMRGKQDEETKDGIYDKALKMVNKADTLSPNNSEIYALKGYIIFMKMAVSPQQRAMKMIPESSMLIGKAIALNPENPRAYLLKGQNAFYTPEMFGGGKEAAKNSLIIATEKFEKFKAKALEPNWGKARCEELLRESK